MPNNRMRLAAMALAATISVALGCRYHGESAAVSVSADHFGEERERMVTAQLIARDITDSRVLQAMSIVPRHELVPENQRNYAYDDRPLPIGEGQTISQPYIVALMTQAARIQQGDRVLELGTGSGYQAAVLAEMTDEVYSIEIIAALGERAADQLSALGYDSIRFQISDGYFGWEEHAPYDAIIVTCAPDHIPRPLVNQLAVGGRMVVPVGPPGAYQSLWLLEKRADGSLQRRNLGGVSFVPMTGVSLEDR